MRWAKSDTDSDRDDQCAYSDTNEDPNSNRDACGICAIFSAPVTDAYEQYTFTDTNNDPDADVHPDSNSNADAHPDSDAYANRDTPSNPDATCHLRASESPTWFALGVLMAFTPDEVEQIRTTVTQVLKTQMPTLLQPLQSQQIAAEQTILTAIKNHVNNALQTLRRVLGK